MAQFQSMQSQAVKALMEMAWLLEKVIGRQQILSAEVTHT